MVDYAQICFVIMPFGRKEVSGGREVDFDRIYAEIFEPAVRRVPLPEGGTLKPRRTDQDCFAGDIGLEMFHYIEYSRFALADISGLNANVFYELGARHRVREAGTVIFRQAAAPIPFDIQSIKAFPYEYELETQAEAARALITRVLSELLVQNRIDSPVRIALMAQQAQGGSAEKMLVAAENAVRSGDFERAIQVYRDASRTQPTNPIIRMKLGILLKDRGRWKDAMEQFDAALGTSPAYAEAWREKGVTENKIGLSVVPSTPAVAPAPGEGSLRRALELNPDDFDAAASLGGVLKRAERWSEARDAYERSREASSDHPYPLLNEIKLRAKAAGKLALAPADRRALLRAQRLRALQSDQKPPYDSPWCFFDLAEIRLYLDKPEEAPRLIREGLRQSDHDWQGETFLKSLELLEPAAGELPGLKHCLEMLREWNTTGTI